MFRRIGHPLHSCTEQKQHERETRQSQHARQPEGATFPLFDFVQPSLVSREVLFETLVFVGFQLVTANKPALSDPFAEQFEIRRRSVEIQNLLSIEVSTFTANQIPARQKRQ